MPSTSPRQKRFMAKAAADPKFAREAGIPTNVAREFHAADRGTGRTSGRSKRRSRRGRRY
jgi:hypothetical protein